MTTLRNAYIIFMPLLLMSVIVDAVYEVPKTLAGSKQPAYEPWDDKHELNQDPTEYTMNGPYIRKMSEDDLHKMQDETKEAAYEPYPFRNNNNYNNFQQQHSKRFEKMQKIPKVVKQGNDQEKGYVPLHEEQKKNMVPISNKKDGDNTTVSIFDNFSKTTKRKDFQRNFQELVTDFKSVENSSEFDKFLNTIVNLYKKHLIFNNDMPSKGSIQMDINFENSYNTDEEVCNAYNLSFQKIYLNNHGFINGNIAGFLNLVGDSTRWELKSETDYLKQKEDLKKKYQHCVKQASTLNEMKTYNFIKNYNTENTEDNYNNVCSNFGERENIPTCSDASPLTRCTKIDMTDNGKDDDLDNNDRRNALNNSHGSSSHHNTQSQTQFVGGKQEPVLNNDTDFYTLHLVTGDVKIKKEKAKLVFNYLSWPSNDNTFFSINVNGTDATGITTLSSFLETCRNIDGVTYNESDIKKMIKKAGTAVNAKTQSRGSPVGNNGSYTLAQPKENKKSTVNTFDLKLALEKLTFAYEESILKKDIKSCKLNRYVLSEVVKMSGESTFVLSLMLLFAISVMSLF